MYEYSFSECGLCRKSISYGDKYGVLVFNIESTEKTPKYPDGVTTVNSSEEVHTMCLECAKKYDSESVKSLID